MSSRPTLAAAPTIVVALLAACASPRSRDGALGAMAPDASAERPIDVTLAELADWPYVDGLHGVPERVLRLTGRRVRMTGVSVPEDAPNGPEFMLYPEALLDLRRPAEVHEIVRVVLLAPRAELIGERVEVIGTFTVSETKPDGFVTDICQLRAEACTKLDAAPNAKTR